MKLKLNLPKSGTNPSRAKLVALAAGILIVGCLGARVLDVLMGKIFGW